MDIILEKKVSLIHGFGIFAKVKIPANLKYYHILLDIIYAEPKPRCARIGHDKYVSDSKVLNWVNHSCNPNSKLDINNDIPVLIAIKDILPNEEITVDYNQTEVPGIKAQCTCHSKNCKKYFVRL